MARLITVLVVSVSISTNVLAMEISNSFEQDNANIQEYKQQQFNMENE